MGSVKLSLFSLGVVFLASCNSSNSLTVENPFTEKGVYELEIMRKKDGSNHEQESQMYTTTKVTMDINSITDDETLINWSYGNTTLEGTGNRPVTQGEQEILDVYKGLNIDLKIKDGKVEIIDYATIYNKVEKLFLTMYGGDTLTENSEMYQQLKKAFQVGGENKVVFLENYFPEIPLFLNHINKSYKDGALYSTDSIESPFGFGHLDLITSIEVFNEDGIKEITKVDSIPRSEIKMAFKQYLEMNNMAEKDNGEFPPIKYSKESVITLQENSNLKYIESKVVFDDGRDIFVNSTRVELK